MYLSGDPAGVKTATQGAGRGRTVPIGTGDRGTGDTLRVMAQLAVAASADYWTIQTARLIVAECPERDTVCQARAIRRWLADNFRFVRDPLRREAIRSPADMIDGYQRIGFVQGDCDEAAGLGWALGEAVGLPAHFVVIALNGDPSFRHVFAELLTGAGWVDLDTTKPRGGPAPEVTRRWVFTL